MGEYADDALDRLNDRDEFGNDGFDGMFCVEDGCWYGHGHKSPRPKTCRHCGKKGLFWGDFNGKWRLFDGDKIHNCLSVTLRFGSKKIIL